MKIRRKQREKRTHAVKWGILVATAALCFVGYWGVQGVLHVMEGWTDDLPSIADTDFTNSAEESVMYASDGSTRLAEFQLEKRDPVTIDQISPFVLQGTVDTEDVRFYEHNGVDIAGIARAVINNITGGQLEGASTITQQLVRNTILTQEANEISIERKIREAELATEMEKQYSKDDILLMYLNTINYGDGCYGIEAAAQNYFQVSAAELTLVQAATLVGIPQSPTYLNPKAYPEACLERRNTVLDRLLAAGHISQEEHDAAQAEELALDPAPEAPSDGIYAFPYFTSYVRAQLFADDNPYDVSYADLFEGGLTIYTSLDPELQQMAEDACADQLDRMSSDLDCSLVAVDTETGQVKAMVGGKDYSVESEYNGMVARAMGIYLLPGANAIATGDAVTARMRELSGNFPEGIDYKIIVDTNDFVMESINEVVHTLMEAMVLVFLVVFIFLQNWRATLIPCIAVPVSIIGTFAGMYALGYTINTLTLFGMVLAIGIVVDDAIVVLENVERIMSTEHLPPREATAKAMSEVTAPVIAIVLVLCAVFIPVSFMGGLAGQMYKQFAITISVSVVLSGIVALTLTPALCALLLKPHAHDHQPARPFVVFNYLFGKTTHRYVRMVRFIKDHGLLSMALFGCMIASLVFLFRVVPGGLVPNEDQGYILGMTILDDGAVQNRTRDVTRIASELLRKDPVVDTVMTLNGLDITSMSSKSNYGTFFAVLKPWSERTTPESSASAISTKVLGVTMMQPEAVTIGFTPPPISGMSTTGGFEGFIQMRGAGTSQDLEATANAFVAEATSRDENGQPKYPAIGTLRSLFSTGAPQLYANLDRERCKDMGISISDVFTAMNATFGALYVNDFNYLGRTFQVRMQAEADYRLLPESLHDIFVRTNKGGMVPLDAIMTLERRTAPQTMERYNVFPAARLMGEPAPGYSSGQALEAMEKVAEKMLSKVIFSSNNGACK